MKDSVQLSRAQLPGEEKRNFQKVLNDTIRHYCSVKRQCYVDHGCSTISILLSDIFLLLNRN
jgi:hypothetical protein